MGSASPVSKFRGYGVLEKTTADTLASLTL
jgi:hypothetical protein